MDKQLIVISREWHEPFIRVDVTEAGIGITMTLEDFILALETETGHALTEAAKKVIASVKRETARVM